MSILKTVFWKILAGMLLVLAFAIASACSNSNEPEVDIEPEEVESFPQLYLSITIPYDAQVGMTRVDDTHPEEPNYDWNDIYENEINLEDMAVYIFTVEDDGSTKLRFFNRSNKEFVNDLGLGSMVIDGSPGRYTIVNLNVTEWPIDQSKDIKLKIVLLCNLRNLGGTVPLGSLYPAVTSGNINTFSIDKILSQSAATGNMIYSINDQWMPGPPQLDVNPLEKEVYRYIPMFGYMEATVPGAELLKSEPYNRIDLHTMWALRASAKIEVIDDIERNINSDYPRIDNVTITNRPSRGCLVPWSTTSTNQYVNGHQVETISYPSWFNTYGESPFECFKDKTIWENVIDEDDKVVLEKEVVKQLFRIYTTEVSKNDIGNLKIVVTVADAPDNTTSYEMTFKQYEKDGMVQPLFDTDIIRNHIYRIRVCKPLTRGGECDHTLFFETSTM